MESTRLTQTTKRTTSYKTFDNNNDDEIEIQQLEDEVTDAYDNQRQSSIETAAQWNDLGNLCRDRGRFEDAHVYYHRALELSRDMDYSSHSSQSSSSSSSSSEELFVESEGLTASLLGNLGLVASERGHDDEAQKRYLQALENLKQPRNNNHKDHKHKDKHTLRQLNVARTWNNLGTLYSKQGNYQVARQYLEQALDKYYDIYNQRRSFQSQLADCMMTPDVAVCYHNLGNLHLDQENYNEAAVQLETALQIHRQCPSTTPTATATTLESLGELCVELGRYAKAIEYYQEVLELQLGTNDREDVGRTAGILGVLCFELGRYETAKTHFETALNVNLPVHQQDDFELYLAGTLDYLGRVEEKLGHDRLAQSYQETSLRLLEQSSRKKQNKVEEDTEEDAAVQQ